MTAIFISYRRQDTKQIAGRIFDKLAAKFGAGQVFIDFDGIPAFVDFHAYLDEAVSRARIVLVLIGHGWAEVRDEAGQRRLDNPDDFVRIEVESALRRGIPMGAVLIDGAAMPKPEQLPQSMRGLLRFNAPAVDAGRDFHSNMDRLIVDVERHLKGRIGTGRPPPPPVLEAAVARPGWASDAGEDKFGRWAEFALDDARQRMRWVEPGTFLMGSPEGEAGRFDAEGPQHEVRLTKGFWLGDTPVTQALWTAAIGNNPSFFKDPKRPVETVSWDDAQQFLNKMNLAVPGLALGLPTEAQWEYACRAGTNSPNYAGDAGKLADIAWFDKNSGGQTHPVATRACNDWGLYDMLGNVLEWCADGRRSYAAKPVTDPAGPLEGASRALRGGSWGFDARFVRAAARNGHDRGRRFNDFGFRCCA
jgi:formylglycine-generating enzyme required for sulfatase activity